MNLAAKPTPSEAHARLGGDEVGGAYGHLSAEVDELAEGVAVAEGDEGELGGNPSDAEAEEVEVHVALADVGRPSEAPDGEAEAQTAVEVDGRPVARTVVHQSACAHEHTGQAERPAHVLPGVDGADVAQAEGLMAGDRPDGPALGQGVIVGEGRSGGAAQFGFEGAVVDGYADVVEAEKREEPDAELESGGLVLCASGCGGEQERGAERYHRGVTVHGVLVIHYAATLFMTGVIWIVQVVHYPLFAGVGAAGYAAYQAGHVRLITWVVLPAMLVELATAVGWVYFVRGGGAPGSTGWGSSAVAWANLAGVGLIWLSTALLQVPAHDQLGQAFDAAAHRRLVDTNWIRTIVWSLRAGALTYLVWRGFPR